MILTGDSLAMIRLHAEQRYPEECCGFLIGNVTPAGKVVRETVQVENEETVNKARRYRIGPDDYRRADRVARLGDSDILGTYHSHPDHPAHPSATDLSEATFPGFVYVIISVHEGIADEVTAWSLSEDRTKFEEEHITVETTLGSQDINTTSIR